MKRILTIIAAIACLCSCKENIFDGTWDPMELDKTHVNFPSEGGQLIYPCISAPRLYLQSGTKWCGFASI